MPTNANPDPNAVMLGERTRKEMRQWLADGGLEAAIIPIGATEQHNEHLALNLDIELSTIVVAWSQFQDRCLSLKTGTARPLDRNTSTTR